MAALGADVIAVGNCSTQGGDVCVWRVQPSGQVTWQKAFGTAAAEVGLDVAVLTDGSLAILAESAGKPWLLHLGSDGKQLASAVNPVPGLTAVAIAAGPAGGAIVAGYSGGVASDGWYARISPEFTVTAQAKVGSVIHGDRFADVAYANGQLWAAGYTANLSGKLLWAVRIDADEKVEEFTLDATLGGFAAVTVAPLGGEALAAGTLANGTAVYYRLAASVASPTKVVLAALGLLPPVAIAGYFPLASAGGGAVVLTAGKVWRYGEVGALAWQTDPAAQEAGLAWTSAATTNKGLWLAGAKAGTTAWLARRDAFGNASCTDSGPCYDLNPSACSDGIPCYADFCSAAVYAENCPQGGCAAVSACGHQPVPGCN